MFRTELTIAPQERQLARTARVLTVGSCFADSLGTRLRLNKVNALVNPFGTVFQPLALAQLLRAAAGEEQDWQQHVVEARGRWQSYDFHSTIGAESPVELLQLIQETVQRVGDFVRTADAVVLTLGTAWAYRLRETGELVSNLHKLPASLFEKELLTADEIVNGLAEVHALLRRANPAIRIILTVSPVRHIKDTLPLNAVSKSVLRVACHYLSELLPGVSYFPAYELLTDELRDYRFYASDMLHPSEVAEDYIWDKFTRAYFDADFGRFRKEWAAVRQSLGHRPLHLGAPEHRTFLDQTVERLERLNGQGVDVRQELREVQRQLAALPLPKPTRAPVAEPDDEERIDIGDSAPATEGVQLTALNSQRAEASVTQPERRQDNRRDGRRHDRNNRNGQDRRPNREAQPVALPEEGVAELVDDSALLTEIAATADVANEVVYTDDTPTLLLTEESLAYPAKKKKRRSRGGAKRTARKHAARLAAGQDDNLAAEELTDELAQETASLTDMTTPPATDSLAADAGTAEEPYAPADTPEQAPAIRKRGTGPTPKKSKVITKSGLVKRGQRGGLYRTPEADADVSAASEAGPATAPIISAPIIPVALSERPAVELAEPPQPALPEPTAPAQPVEEPDLAATVLGLYSSKPRAAVVAPKTKRGRPKATATAEAAPAEEASAAGAPGADSAGSVAVEPPTELMANASEPVPGGKTVKKRAARPSKATKPAAAKKVAAKPATPKKAAAKSTARRGRTAATPTPPATDEPTA